MEYYIDSVNYISNLLQSPHFFVFSNDISWAKNNLKIPFNCTYVYEPCQFHDFSDMYLMSLCNHNIIANSTYSWWGAFLNSSNDKVVIAPKSWYCGRINNFTNDLIPDTWIRM
jgi:hypothetical protein